METGRIRMNSNGLLSILTFSAIRKDILFYLRNNESKPLDKIKKHMGISLTPAILPRIKELKAADLIEQGEDGEYSITDIGDVVATHYKPLLDVLEVIEENPGFWTSHDISPIPKDIRYRIGELKGCNVVTRSGSICEPHLKFTSAVINSFSFRGATCVFFKEWILLFLELSCQGFPIEIIVTQEIYDKIEQEYAVELEEGLANPKAHLYICGDELKAAFAVMDGIDGKFLSLSLYNKVGYDLKQDLMGTTPESFKWGEDLFEYYKSKSIEVLSSETELVTCSGITKETF